MFIAIDLIIIAIMAAVIISAAQRGFVSSLFGLVTAALSLIAAIVFYRELGAYINEKFVFDEIEPRLVGFINSIIADKSEVSTETLLNALPGDIVSLMNTFGIDVEGLLQGITSAPGELASVIAAELSLALANAIAFGALFLAAFVVLSLICLILNLIFKLPLLKGINKVLGVIFGIVEALVLGIIIAKLAVALCGVYGSLSGDSAMTGIIEQTVVAKFLLSICPW